MLTELISTKDMPREEWLKYRRLGIGGSDAAALVGMSDYATPYTIWADKTGRLSEKEDNEAMRQGRDLEAYVASRFEEDTGKKVRRRNAILKNTDYPFALANIDREVVGEKAGLECKTTSSLNLRQYAGGEYPDRYYVQCMHYLAVTGWDRWYLAVLVLNKGFYIFTIERNAQEIDTLMEAERDFWDKYIVTDIAPSVDGEEPTGQAQKQVWPGNKDLSEGMNLCDAKSEKAVLDYKRISALIKDLEKEKELAGQTIKEEMGDNQIAFCGDYKISWSNQSRSSFDASRYVKDNPGINLSDYYKKTESRTFRVDEIKRKKEG